jgi:uncharacterized protein
MSKTALVTGATTGIGFELTKLLAADRYDLILVSRDEQALRRIAADLQARHNITVMIFAKDLAVAKNAEDLVRELQEKNIAVHTLINNAGFGLAGAFIETDLKREIDMIQLNIVSLVTLTKLLGRQMAQRRQGKILNVASTAAFQPGPFMVVYYATKAFVLSFSEGLAEELASSGVTVTALCPGPTATQFSKRAQVQESTLFKGALLPVLDAATVARIGYRGLLKGRRVVIPGLMNKLGVQGVRLLPRRLATGVTRRLNT